MKHLILPLALLLGLCTWALPVAEAQSSATSSRSVKKDKKKKQSAKEKREAQKARKAAAKAEKEAAKAEKEAAKAQKLAAKKAAAAKRAFETTEPTTPVAKFLKEQTYATDARPNLGAKYYVIYRSSSTCVHCHKMMPQVLAAYAEMQSSGKVELIFDSYDGELSATTAYLKKHNIPFPAVHNPAMQKMPGALHKYLALPPGMFIVTAEGKRIAEGDARGVLPDWKKHTLDKETPAED